MGSGWTEVLFSGIHVHTLTVISRLGDWDDRDEFLSSKQDNKIA